MDPESGNREQSGNSTCESATVRSGDGSTHRQGGSSHIVSEPKMACLRGLSSCGSRFCPSDNLTHYNYMYFKIEIDKEAFHKTEL